MEFERKPPTEEADIAEIARDILIVQQRFAQKGKRALGRGTHTKGVCCRATFEVFDLSQTVPDPVLRTKLARGVFARPGRYAASVRFANAASTIERDSKADVRAMSFSIELPPGSVAPAATRHDYTMNNAPVFPINNAHDFASLMRVQSKKSGLRKLWAFLRLSFSDMKAVLKTAKVGKAQQNQPIHPYQQTRYWSNVPFLHGQDQAIKYSAVPSPSNAGQPIGKGDLVLHDELVRHLTRDPEPGSFDFRLQLLDTSAMTYGGKTQDAPFWVENAMVEWNEAEAPFHTVARLTLERDSITDADQCEAAFIDVTENSIPDSRPIGGINRARWLAESSSRRARLAAAGRQVQTAPARGLGALTVGKLLKYAMFAFGLLALGVLLLGLLTVYQTNNNKGTLPPEEVAEVIYPNQGWGDGVNAADRQTYYYTAQGAGLKDLRYSWFLNLEMPLSQRRLADPEFIRRYGFVVDEPSPMNPDGVPVGFSKHFDRELGEDMLDLTCAACHTGQLIVTSASTGRKTALRIDGGSAIHAFTDSKLGHFVPTLLSSLSSTIVNPLKFRRFARRVLGENYSMRDGLALRWQMLDVVGQLGAMGFNEKWHGLVGAEEGYGRTDALARISNTVFGDHLDKKNYQKGDAPVNYPPVWNIWKFDWVQYNASVSQPMARNIGESMGTGAKYTLLNPYGQPLPAHERFSTTTMLDNLHTIETTLRKLAPPVWDEAVLGPVDRAQAEQGRKLFNKYCVGCHGPFEAPPALKTRNAPGKTADQAEWVVRTVCVADIGTDPNTATNFDTALIDITKTGLTRADLQKVAWESWTKWNAREAARLESEIASLSIGPQSPQTTATIAKLRSDIAGLYAKAQAEIDAIDPARLSPGAALSYVGTLIRDKAYKEGRYTTAEQSDLDGFGTLDMPQVLRAYKPRPLAGIWATPPFLHNGSVPTVWDLLSTVEERPKQFRVGSREYDVEKLGLKAVGDPYWTLDATISGNRNTGHEFSDKFGTFPREWNDRAKDGIIGPRLTDDEKRAIIAHLKLRTDTEVAGPPEPGLPAIPAVPAQCPPTAKARPANAYAAGGR